MLTSSQIAIRYTIFAILAMIANLAAQRLVLAAISGVTGYTLALAAGTGCGLVVKFILDKKWIFYDRAEDARTEARKFTLYTLTGAGTTLLFWGTETTFWLIWPDTHMRELGALLGLTAGYFIKYRLDRHFVFRADQNR